MIIHAVPKFVRTVSHEHPGYDFIELHNGTIMIIDKDGVGVYKNQAAVDNGDQESWAPFNTPVVPIL